MGRKILDSDIKQGVNDRVEKIKKARDFFLKKWWCGESGIISLSFFRGNKKSI